MSLAGLRRFAPLFVMTAAALSFTLPASTQGSRPPARRHVFVNGREAADGEVLVKYRDQQAQRRARIEARSDADESEAMDRHGLRRLHSRRFGTAELLSILRSDPDVEYAEPNYVLYGETTTPNDPSLNAEWGLFNTGFNTMGGGGIPGSDIDALSAWDITTGSRTYVVGVIDTGVNYSHPDLAANMWSAPAQFSVNIGGQTITCAAGTHGFNAITRTCDPMDDNFHGTHVSGTIGAVGDNGLGVVGVNWITNIMGLKFLGSSGGGYTSDAIAAIQFAIQAKAHFGASADIRVLSNSWGGGGDQALLTAINDANANDMLFVAAAGNSHVNLDTSPHYPAAYTAPNMVTVASTDSSDQLSTFSNYSASLVHLGAPGTGIYSTSLGTGYVGANGTSMATPHVSGAAMLALSACSLTTATLKSLLLDNVEAIPALSGITTTGGRLNVARAIQNCQYPKVTRVTLSSNKSAPQTPNTTITWTATATWGKAPLQYRWVLFDGTTWSIAQDFSTANTFAWTPTTSNANYVVSVRVRSAWNSGAYEATSANYPFVIRPLVTSATATPNVAAPQSTGTTVTWTAAASGGTAPYEYRWLLNDGTTTTALTSWASSNTYAWTPTAANSSYAVSVEVRGAGNTTVAEYTSAAVPYAIMGKVSTVTLAANKTAPQAPNTAITWTATATGGQAPLQYRFVLFDGTTWSIAQDFSTANTFVWTPTVANANYVVSVRARSDWNSGAYEATSANYPFAIRARVSNVTIAPSVAAPQAAGTTVTWTATPTGGEAPLQYQWALYDGTSWSDLTAWTTTSTYAWTPTVVNANYAMTVRVRSAWNTGTAEAVATQQAFAIKPKATSVTLASDKTAPQAPNTTVTWTATATGGEAPLQYRFVLFDGSAWSIAQDFSTANTFAWTPTVANANYIVSVRVRSNWNSGAYEATSTNYPFPIRALITGATATPGVAAPQAVGTTVTWTAAASGGTAPYEYRWLLNNGTTTTALTSWTSSNTYAWTPTVTNASYAMSVEVRGAGNTGSAEFTSAAVPYAIKPKVSAVTLSSDKTAPQAPNTAITWTATATGGEAPLQYRFVLFDGSAWSIAQDFSTANTFAWTPTVANANYIVSVRVRSNWNSGAYEATSANYPFAIRALVSGATATPSVASPQGVGTTVTWTAAASGGTAPYEYRWLLNDGTTTTALTSWTSSNTYAWTPTVTNASYAVSVEVRGAGNTSAAEFTSAAVPYAIKPRVSAVTLSSNKAAPQAPNTAITWTATATGGEAPLQYRFVLFDGSAWSIAQDFSTANTFAWTPTIANANYIVSVRVRSNWNSGAYEATSANYSFPIRTLVTGATATPGVASPQGIGTTVTWTAAASGGTAPYEYRWLLNNGTTTTALTSWSSSNSYAWTPSATNASYAMSVEVRGAGNTGSAEFTSAAVPYAIMAKVSAATLSVNKTSPQAANTTITWTANATGGQGPLQYRWVLFDGSTWSIAQDFSTANTFAWTPTANGNYIVAVRVRSAWNSGAYEATSANYSFTVGP